MEASSFSGKGRMSFFSKGINIHFPLTIHSHIMQIDPRSIIMGFQAGGGWSDFQTLPAIFMCHLFLEVYDLSPFSCYNSITKYLYIRPSYLSYSVHYFHIPLLAKLLTIAW